MKLNFLNLCFLRNPQSSSQKRGQDLNRIKKAYDAVAGEYAKEFRGEHARKPMDRTMLDRFAMEIGNTEWVWDLGCGPGQTSAYLHECGMRVAGLDLSEKSIAEARKEHPGIDFRKGNMLDLDLPTASVAGIVAFYAIVHFTRDQVKTAFREIHRVLKPGGRFLFTYHIGAEILHLEEYLGKPIDLEFMFFPTDFISRALAEAGFNITEIVERDPYPDIEYQSRRAYVWARKVNTVKSLNS